MKLKEFFNIVRFILKNTVLVKQQCATDVTQQLQTKFLEIAFKYTESFFVSIWSDLRIWLPGVPHLLCYLIED